jgi:peptidoglycan/LPS O-acetylase OafA/YrhL
MNRGLSLYLDLIRVSAAIVVVLTHLAYDRFSAGMLHPWRAVGNDAVMVFFVLSGLVIAYAVETRDRTLRDYTLSRMARLWSVAVPAILLTVLLDQTGRALNPVAYEGWWYQDNNPLLKLVNAFTFTNQMWFTSNRLFTNGPYWSLGYEFWYYAIFAAMTFLTGARRRWAVALLCLAVGPKILVLFPVWLLGVWVWRRMKTQPVTPAAGWALFLGSALAYALFRASPLPLFLKDWTYATLGASNTSLYLTYSDEVLASYIIGPLVAAHFIGAGAIAASLERLLAPLAGAIRWLAQSTFAIYLVHYPLLQCLASVVPYDPTSPTQVSLLLLAVLAGCIGVGVVTERRKGALRRWLDRLSARWLPATAR